MKKPKGEYAIQTVVNAMRLLEAFHDEDELGVTELARRLSLHKNNVFRLLATLAEQGYIEQSNASDRYRLGVRTLALGQAFQRGRGLLRRARPVLEALADELNESAHLAVLRDFEVVHLDGAQGRQLVLTGLRVGQRLPLHCTALGKVLLGCSPETVRQAYDRALSSGEGLAARTSATIVDRDKFFEHVRSAASAGFALDLEECEPGLCCAAAPVYDASQRMVGALSVSGPACRLSEERMLRSVVPAVTGAAEALSRELGWQTAG
jgi:DNA-binding IclR family transcriptional regulator